MAKGESDSSVKTPVGYRFPRHLIARLRQRSARSGATQNDLAERYIEEGLRQEEHPSIYFRTAAAGRRPALVGSRLDVQDVITTLRQNENSIEDTAEYLAISPAAVGAAVRYYAAFQDEVDRLVAEAEEFAARERELWERQQKVLG